MWSLPTGVRPDPEKLKAMADMSAPLVDGRPDKKLVQSALGLFNYYRRYVDNYAKRAAPLVELVRVHSPCTLQSLCIR